MFRYMKVIAGETFDPAIKEAEDAAKAAAKADAPAGARSP
jgi:hypothetical protein